MIEQTTWHGPRRKELILLPLLGAFAAAAFMVSPALASSPAGSKDGGVQGAFPLTNGGWRQAQKVKGLATLGAATAEIYSVSCGSPGNCSAVGSYNDGSQQGAQEAFVVDEKNGAWANAEQVPGMATLKASTSEVESVSCASPGNCSAGRRLRKERSLFRGLCRE